MFIRHNFDRIKNWEMIRRIRHGVPNEELQCPFERAILPIYCCVGLAVLGLTLAFLLTSFQLDIKGLGSPVTTFTSLILGGFALRRFGHRRMAGAMEAIGILGLFSLLIAFSLAILCATNLSLVDDMLIRADAALGFSWIDLVRSLEGYDVFNVSLVYFYKSIRWQPFLLICTLMVLKKDRFLWVFLLSWMIGLMLTAALFPFFPAVAAINYYGVSLDATAHAANFVDWMQGLRNGSIRVIDHSSIKGIVTFPSFHASAAIYFMWGFWKVPWLRLPFFGLNVAMLFATIVIGGHYLVDILGGLLVAVLSIGVSSLILRNPGVDGMRTAAKSTLPDEAERCC